MSSVKTHNAIVQPCKLSADIWVGLIIVLLGVVLLGMVRCILPSLENGIGVWVDVEGIREEGLVIYGGKTEHLGRVRKGSATDREKYLWAWGRLE